MYNVRTIFKIAYQAVLCTTLVALKYLDTISAKRDKPHRINWCGFAKGHLTKKVLGKKIGKTSPRCEEVSIKKLKLNTMLKKALRLTNNDKSRVYMDLRF